MNKKTPQSDFPKPTVAGIIINNSKILLTKRSKVISEAEKWCLPGGHIEFNETAKQAIKREIKEELGINTTKQEFIFYFDEIIKRLNTHAIVLIFLVNISGKIKINWEVSQAKFFTKKQIQKLDIAFQHKKIINKFYSKKF